MTQLTRNPDTTYDGAINSAGGQDDIVFKELYRFITVVNKGTGDITVYFQTTASPIAVAFGADMSHLVASGSTRVLTVPRPDGFETPGVDAQVAGEGAVGTDAIVVAGVPDKWTPYPVSVTAAATTTPVYTIEGALTAIQGG